MTVSIRDIAKSVGVSHQTVSSVLNDKKRARISAATQQLIRAKAEEMGYTPNAIARGLKSQRLKLLGATFPQPNPTWITSDHYGVSILTGIISGAYDRGYSTTIFHRPWEDAKRSATGYRGQGIDGYLVVAPPPASDMVAGLSALGIPLVVVSSPSDEYGVPSVAIDNSRGVRLVLDHLRGLGHRRIAYVGDDSGQYDFVARRRAFVAQMEEDGCPVPPEYLPIAKVTQGRGEEICKEYARALFALPQPPTAIFACNDDAATYLLEAVRDLGIRVPEDLSLVGFDDTLKAAMVTPALTTVHQPLVEMGSKGASLLVSLIEKEPVEPWSHLFQPELVVRGSTSVPRS